MIVDQLKKDSHSSGERFSTLCGGQRILGVVHLPCKLPAPAVIISHGLFGSKDSSKIVSVSECLSDMGMVAVRYDHRGCGKSEGKISNTTLTSRLADLKAVSSFIGSKSWVRNAPMGLLGSSMGGLVSLWAMAACSEFRAVVVWATPWRISSKGRHKTDFGMDALRDGFFEDLKKYDLGRILGRLKRCLIVHGQSDELVPAGHAIKIFHHLSSPKRLELLSGADHRFSCPETRRRANLSTASFLETHLLGASRP